jgi:hypothetical protein
MEFYTLKNMTTSVLAMKLTSEGHCHIAGNVFSQWSNQLTGFDARNHDMVQPSSSDGLAIVNSLPVRDFVDKETQVARTGLLAQEVGEVLPSAVSGDADGVEKYEVSPALGRVYVPAKPEVRKPYAEATEEELSNDHLITSLADEHGNIETVLVIESECEEHDLTDNISYDDFENGDFNEAAKWEETSAAVMDERIAPMGLSNDALVPMLVKAVQELTAEVLELRDACEQRGIAPKNSSLKKYVDMQNSAEKLREQMEATPEEPQQLGE